MFPNTDAVFFPAPVADPDGRSSYAMLHRPMWDLGWLDSLDETEHSPAGMRASALVSRPGVKARAGVPAGARVCPRAQ